MERGVLRTSVMNCTEEVAGYLTCRIPPRFPWTAT